MAWINCRKPKSPPDIQTPARWDRTPNAGIMKPACDSLLSALFLYNFPVPVLFCISVCSLGGTIGCDRTIAFWIIFCLFIVRNTRRGKPGLVGGSDHTHF